MGVRQVLSGWGEDAVAERVEVWAMVPQLGSA